MLGARTLFCLASLLALSGCRMDRDTVAEVDGRPIALREFEDEVRALSASFGKLPPPLEQDLPRLRRGVLERLVNRELMLAEAGRRGIRLSAAEVERALAPASAGMPAREFEATLAEAGTDRERWRRAAERDLTIQKLQEQIGAAVTVSDREIDDWIARHRERAPLPEEVRASQILTRSEADALEARLQILGGATFADVARRVSLSPDAERGGDLGYFSRGQMPPEFEEVAFALALGRLSEVVETPYGFHLFLVTDRRPARPRSAADERLAVRATLLAEKREEAFRAWLAEARGRAKIRVNRTHVAW